MKALNLLYKLRHRSLPIILICLIILIDGCDSRKTAPVSRIPEVAVIHVKTEKVAITAELPGRTSAYLTAEVRPQVGGIIQKRLFEEGADVKAGDVLYQIDPAPYQAAYDMSKAGLTKAEAAIVSIRYQFERNKTLIKSHSVSQKDLETSESALYTALADIQTAKAAVETARINLDYTKVRASISGRIGRSDITVGALATTNNIAPLATIQQIDPIFVDVVQSSADFLRLKRNVTDGLIKRRNEKEAKVKLFFEDGSPYPLEGEMKFMDLRVDQTTGSFILRVVFPNPEYALLPGMYVRAVMEEGIVENAILVPHQSVSRNFKGEPIAFIVDASDKIEQRNLVIDRSIGNSWLLKSGLNPGDRLIVEGFQRVRPGNIVKAVPFESKANDTTIKAATEPSSSTDKAKK